MTSRRRAAIIIHFSTTNYGNHLVNYAARRILEDRGYDVTLLIPEGKERPRLLGELKRLPAKLRRLGLLTAVARVRGRLQRAMAAKPASASSESSEQKRRDRFAEFSREYLRPRSFEVRARAELARAYDRIAIGSDQIWNYDYGVQGAVFADFAPPGRAITLSPSVGHERLPAEWLPTYRRWLSHFQEVGTREIEWTRSLTPSSGAPRFTLLIDPTLMFDGEAWVDLAAPAPEAAGQVLLYHLGQLLPEQDDYVSRLASHHGLGVLRLSDTVGGRAWETNAADFLGMISASECVVTDSYHGAIFAFLFDKPLVLLERHGFAGAMNTRTRTLTERLNLSNRYLHALPVEHALAHDYTEAYSALRGYRDEYQAYLDRLGLLSARSEDPHPEPRSWGVAT